MAVHLRLKSRQLAGLTEEIENSLRINLQPGFYMWITSNDKL